MSLHAVAAEKTRVTNRVPTSLLVLFCFEEPMECFISTTIQTWASCTRSMQIIDDNSPINPQAKLGYMRRNKIRQWTAGRFLRLAATMRLRLRCGAVYKRRPQDARGGVRQGASNELLRIENAYYRLQASLGMSRQQWQLVRWHEMAWDGMRWHQMAIQM